MLRASARIGILFMVCTIASSVLAWHGFRLAASYFPYLGENGIGWISFYVCGMALSTSSFCLLNERLKKRFSS